MATRSDHYGFLKPDEDDFYDVQEQNGNWDKADKVLRELESRKIDVSGGDASEAVIEMLEEGEAKYPTPAAGESLKVFLGKVKKCLGALSFLETNRTIYVALTGDDAAGNGELASPFRTISRALSVIPRNLNGYTATIVIADGIYDEDVFVQGFSNGSLKIYSTTSSKLGDSCKIKSITVKECSGYVLISGIYFTNTEDSCIRGYASTAILVDYCKTDVSSSDTTAIYFAECKFRITHCSVSNRYAALMAYDSEGLSADWLPPLTGNQIGIRTIDGGVLHKKGQQPYGVIAEKSEFGAMIVQNNGTQISGIVSNGLTCSWGTIRGGYYKHGNDSSGITSVTIQLNIWLTSDLKAGATYTISGFPRPDVPFDIAVACQRSKLLDACYLNNDDGTIVLIPCEKISALGYLIFNCTYRADLDK